MRERRDRLPRGRNEGERARTVGQLKLFADVVRTGEWADLQIDHAIPHRKPMPRADLRLRNVPLGPVAVFGASNFPLAFSVAGGRAVRHRCKEPSWGTSGSAMRCSDPPRSSFIARTSTPFWPYRKNSKGS